MCESGQSVSEDQLTREPRQPGFEDTARRHRWGEVSEVWASRFAPQSLLLCRGAADIKTSQLPLLWDRPISNQPAPSHGTGRFNNQPAPFPCDQPVQWGQGVPRLSPSARLDHLPLRSEGFRLPSEQASSKPDNTIYPYRTSGHVSLRAFEF